MKLSISNKYSKYTRRKKSKHLKKTYKKKVGYVRKTHHKIINFNLKRILRGGNEYEKHTDELIKFLIEYYRKHTQEEELLKLTPQEVKLLKQSRELTKEEKNQALEYFRHLPVDEKKEIIKLQQKINLSDRTTWLYYYLHAKYPDIIKPDSTKPYGDNHSRMDEVDG
jgi:hypothetical protein